MNWLWIEVLDRDWVVEASWVRYGLRVSIELCGLSCNPLLASLGLIHTAGECSCSIKQISFQA